MFISKSRLPLLVYALTQAMHKVHNQIATCPDVVEYADDINELKEHHRELHEWLESVNARTKMQPKKCAQQALRVLQNSPHQNWVHFQNGEVILDGTFTPSDIEAIADVMHAGHTRFLVGDDDIKKLRITPI